MKFEDFFMNKPEGDVLKKNITFVLKVFEGYLYNDMLLSRPYTNSSFL